jgi:hypothetical protein
MFHNLYTGKCWMVCDRSATWMIKLMMIADLSHPESTSDEALLSPCCPENVFIHRALRSSLSSLLNKSVTAAPNRPAASECQQKSSDIVTFARNLD